MPNHAFHSDKHTLDVHAQVVKLGGNIKTQISALMHDALHPGSEAQSPRDEEMAAREVKALLEEHERMTKETMFRHKAEKEEISMEEYLSYRYGKNIIISEENIARFVKKIEKRIKATILPNRSQLTNKQDKILADADISNIGREFDYFFEQSVLLFIEQNEHKSLEQEMVLKFFREDQPKFFAFILALSPDGKNPFLTEEARKLYPHFDDNREKIQSMTDDEIMEKFTSVMNDYYYEKYIKKFQEKF